MSGLEAVLAGHISPGVYRWQAAYDVADVRHMVEHAWWRFAHIDGWVFGSKAEFLVAVGEALDFPDYYGRNLDALEECLADLDQPTVLLWDGWSSLARADELVFRTIIEIFAARSDVLAVLLRGEGPEPGLTSLD